MSTWPRGSVSAELASIGPVHQASSRDWRNVSASWANAVAATRQAPSHGVTKRTLGATVVRANSHFAMIRHDHLGAAHETRIRQPAAADRARPGRCRADLPAIVGLVPAGHRRRAAAAGPARALHAGAGRRAESLA